MAASSGPPHSSSGSYAATLRTCPSPMAPCKANRPPVAGPKDARGAAVLDQRGKILVLTLDAVRRPERATHPSTSSVGQVHHERIGKRTSEPHHVLQRVYATVQQDHARALAQTPIADPGAIGGHDRPRRDNLCCVVPMMVSTPFTWLTSRLIEQRSLEPKQPSASNLWTGAIAAGLRRGICHCARTCSHRGLIWRTSAHIFQSCGRGSRQTPRGGAVLTEGQHSATSSSG